MPIFPSITWGSVDGSGNITAGSGDFTVAVVGSGQYKVTFNTAFPTVPVVVGNQNNFQVSTQFNTDSVAFPFVTKSYFIIHTGRSDGQLDNRPFGFIAMGT